MSLLLPSLNCSTKSAPSLLNNSSRHSTALYDSTMLRCVGFRITNELQIKLSLIGQILGQERRLNLQHVAQGRAVHAGHISRVSNRRATKLDLGWRSG
jgi:hypothetical protein